MKLEKSYLEVQTEEGDQVFAPVVSSPGGIKNYIDVTQVLTGMGISLAKARRLVDDVLGLNKIIKAMDGEKALLVIGDSVKKQRRFRLKSGRYINQTFVRDILQKVLELCGEETRIKRCEVKVRKNTRALQSLNTRARLIKKANENTTTAIERFQNATSIELKVVDTQEDTEFINTIHLTGQGTIGNTAELARMLGIANKRVKLYHAIRKGIDQGSFVEDVHYRIHENGGYNVRDGIHLTAVGLNALNNTRWFKRLMGFGELTLKPLS